jgi:Mn2+/Fe2+ NRAMP family transporter
MPDVKQKITNGAEQQFAKLPAPYNQKAQDAFLQSQQDFASIVTHAFSDSLQRIFIVASVLIGISAILVFTLKERKLHSASPQATPGEM